MMRATSLRQRLRKWIAVVVALAIGASAIASMLGERATVLRLQAATGRSLVAHLASMPDFGADPSDAARQVEALSRALAPAGSFVQLAGASTAAPGPVIAARTVRVGAGELELRYGVDSARLRALAARSALVHALYAAFVLALALPALDWILRRKLVWPLERIAHQIRFMQSGGGWSPSLPPGDLEISNVTSALRELGPALERQVRSWIDAERRAAAARAVADLHMRLRRRGARALALLSDLQARDSVGPEAKQRLRAAIAEIDGFYLDVAVTRAELFRDVQGFAAATPWENGRTRLGRCGGEPRALRQPPLTSHSRPA